jgi:hypothetical protein
MIIVLILVVLWGVVLGPSIFRKVRSTNSDRSISSFHRSLDFLERSGPKVVEPAYRLVDDEIRPLTPTIAKPQPLPRVSQPTLVLLGPYGPSGEEQMNERQIAHYRDDDYGYREDVYEDDYEDRYDDQWDRRQSPGPTISAARMSRREAARRRRNILFTLVGAIFLTAIIGLFMSFLFYLTILSIVALVGYVGLMAYAAKTGMIGEKGYERHVAHGEAAITYDDQDRWHAEPVASNQSSREVRYLDESFDGEDWWDEPRQAAAR